MAVASRLFPRARFTRPLFATAHRYSDRCLAKNLSVGDFLVVRWIAKCPAP